MTALEWILLTFAVMVIGGGGDLFWRGLSPRPHGPDHPRPPARWVSS